MSGQYGKPEPITAWTLRYKDVAPREEGLREALCTLGNGYFATRGAAPESRADGTHYPGTYIAGCYNQLRTEIAGRTVENESLVNAPNWLPLTFAVGDGGWFGLDHTEVLSDRQDLDLRRGVLTRLLRVRDQLGHRTLVTQRRFVHMGAAHLGALETTIMPENWSGRLHVRSEIDGTVTNDGVLRYRELGRRHLVPCRARALAPDGMLLVVETSQSHIRIAEAVRTRVFHGGVRVSPEATVSQQPGRISQQFQIDMARRDKVLIEKTVAITTSRDRAISDVGVAAADLLEMAGSFDDLLAQHTMAWAHLWERFEIRLVGGEDNLVLPVLRLHALHLLQTVGLNTVDRDAGVPARGLHGEAYRGHVFWDELFVLPVLNLRLPQLSRSLMAYRYHRLPAARRAAIQAGHAGAMFPWQSGSDGSEQSALLHLNPQSGHWLPDVTYLQRHVGIAIAYNVWQYYQATGDLAFLADQGAEIILEIARFFASMATFDHELDRYVIRGVVGPDEFHTGYPDSPHAGIDNNAYTNVMTSWLLLHAAEVLDILPVHRRQELTDRLGITAAEQQRWEHVSRRIYVPFHGDGIISQFEGYEKLNELDWEDYRARYGNIRRLDRILEAEADSPNRYKVSKQPDVLMLLYLLSPGELTALLHRLGYDWSPRQISGTIDYYLARTCDGSTLSTLVNAWVLARARRERTLEQFIEALRTDVADIQGGTTAEGIHLAAMAGTIDVLERCYAGIETRDDVLWLDPYWLQSLGALELPILYREHVITVTVADHTVLVHDGSGNLPPVRVGYNGQVHELGPGQTFGFRLGQAAAEPAVTPLA